MPTGWGERVTDFQRCGGEANLSPLKVLKSFFSQETADIKMQVRRSKVRFTRFVAQHKKIAEIG
jgi:hypothetical protein